ncbi:MAG: ABC transporter ATP-binding protein [Candidatus Limnocylindria bacterium]
MPTPLLEAHALRKTYRLSRRNVVEALRGVEIRVERGEMIAIMGPSGSGKSTLMHLIGLLHSPDRDYGPAPSMVIDGRDVLRLSDRERTQMRARSMGFVFQAFNLVPTLTAAENVALAGEYAGRPRGESSRAAREALGWVGLADRAGHRPMELSGGEQQRAAIARALVNRPALILADEPTGNLDSQHSAEVIALLRRFNRERGQTVVVVTHDEQIGASCDRIVAMRDGVVVSSDQQPGARPAASGGGLRSWLQRRSRSRPATR